MRGITSLWLRLSSNIPEELGDKDRCEMGHRDSHACVLSYLFILGDADIRFPQQPASFPQSQTGSQNRKGQSGAQEDGGLFRIIDDSKHPALHVKLTPPPRHHRRSCFIKGLGWAQMSSQSSFRWDEYKVGNTVKGLKNKKPTGSKQDGKRGKCYEVLTVTEQQFHRTERKRQKPNEARWKKEQTKDLLKAAEDARDKNSMARSGRGGAGHIQRHFCVQIGLMSLCYKSFFFVFTAPESSIGLYCFIKIYMFWT